VAATVAGGRAYVVAQVAPKQSSRESAGTAQADAAGSPSDREWPMREMLVVCIVTVADCSC